MAKHGITKGQPFVSVITVNWNGKKWLPKLLESLAVQSYANFEVIVVDNNSSDDSLAYITKHHPRVRTVALPRNVGFAGGNNKGIVAAKGELILMVNNDAWVEKDFIQSLVAAYQHSGADVVGPLEADYKKRAKPPYSTTIDPLGHPVYMMRPDHNFYLCGVSLLFSKQLYRTTRGMDDNFFMYAEEVDWFWRLNLLGKKIHYAPDTFIYHHGAGSTGSQAVKVNTFLWRNQNTLQMLLKNYAWYTLVWALPLYVLQNIFEIFAFTVVMKPQIAATYIKGWAFNIRHLPHITSERRWIQAHRTQGDRAILKRMYLGPGKLKHLQHFWSHRNRKRA